MTKKFNLSEPTIFPDLNKQENNGNDFARRELDLKSLKYKHFRAVLEKPEEQQMHYLMLEMTGLSEDDAGELTPNDAAELYKLIFESMKGYMELGQTIMSGISNTKA